MTDDTARVQADEMIKVADDIEMIINSRISYSINREGYMRANVRLLAETISGYIHHDVLAAWSSRAPAHDKSLIDFRPFRFAPGNYTSICGTCEKVFQGDKRATCCLPCAAAKWVAANTGMVPKEREKKAEDRSPPPGTVIVCADCDCDQMFGHCAWCKEAQKAGRYLMPAKTLEGAPAPDERADAGWIKTSDRLPEKPGKRDYEYVDCLIFYKGEVLKRPWNCEHLCWDDEHYDDHFCDPKEPSHWMLVPAAPIADRDREGAR